MAVFAINCKSVAGPLAAKISVNANLPHWSSKRSKNDYVLSGREASLRAVQHRWHHRKDEYQYFSRCKAAEHVNIRILHVHCSWGLSGTHTLSTNMISMECLFRDHWSLLWRVCVRTVAFIELPASEIGVSRYGIEKAVCSFEFRKTATYECKQPGTGNSNQLRHSGGTIINTRS